MGLLCHFEARINYSVIFFMALIATKELSQKIHSSPLVSLYQSSYRRLTVRETPKIISSQASSDFKHLIWGFFFRLTLAKVPKISPSSPMKP
jgi:hypothetical protein